ncbi:dynamin family protein [Solibacillus daqui]|uniref:dynamin family protein n=1 Tax=Solibacillus daqui TaxID=2912187 RepID=UPI002366E320|nr:dynamin family protein [Solibacillus daqui]
MTEQLFSLQNSIDNQTTLQQFIERLKPLHVILSQNTYVKDMTNRLNRIIEDASSQPIMLFLGKERVGKTTLINSLLGRSLLEDSKNEPTHVNAFIKYGEQECIKAIFLDGMVATFDISKLNLLTVSTNECAEIIREHIDYLEIYIKHDLLKDVTIIDSIGLEVGANNTAYFSQSLLQRVDEVFFVLRAGSSATEDEVNFIKKLNTLGVTANLVINGIDQLDHKVESFIEKEKNVYGEYIGHSVAVSALNALQSRKTNNSQLLIDSRITQLTQLIQNLANNQQKKTRHVVELFINWLERFRKEVELIPFREPYVSAFANVEQYSSDFDLEFTRKQRDLALISAYEEEYASVSNVFKGVQTLYQLLQKLASDLYLRDPLVEKYEEIAVLYQKNVRDYRKLHVDYTMEYARLEKQYKKQTHQNLAFPIPREETQGVFLERINSLNKIQSQLTERLELIGKYEEFVRNNLYVIQNRLNELAKKRLSIIQGQVSDLNIQRKRERTYLKSYADKLTEFNCIIEAQSFLMDAILPYLLEQQLPISEQEKAHIRNTIECICATDLTHQALYKRLNIADTDDLLTQMDIDAKFKLIGLSLTEADILSEIPELPNVIEQ